MVETTVRYLGNLRCDAVHAPSRSTIQTDAPVDNHGKGERFSPTDLVGAALATCMATLMGIHAGKLGIDLTGMTVRCEKEMTKSAPRRIASLRTVVTVPLAADHPQRAVLERAAEDCPVRKSLDASVETPIEWVYTG